MDTYTWALVGVLAFGVIWTPVVLAAWVRDIEGEPETVSLVVWRPGPAYEPVLEDMRGSIGITVARHTGKRFVRPLRAVYVYAARHVSQAWERPSAFVRRHARTGKQYHDTLSAAVARGRNFLGDVSAYVARHDGTQEMRTA